MSDLLYLDLSSVLILYAEILGSTVEVARNNVRDAGRLESALERPRRWAEYEEADVALQAAVLAHGIAETQPVLDGNKRLAVVAMITFLDVNEYELTADDDLLFDAMMELSQGLAPERLANILRPYVQPRFSL